MSALPGRPGEVFPTVSLHHPGGPGRECQQEPLFMVVHAGNRVAQSYHRGSQLQEPSAGLPRAGKVCRQEGVSGQCQDQRGERESVHVRGPARGPRTSSARKGSAGPKPIQNLSFHGLWDRITMATLPTLPCRQTQ